MGKNAIVLCGGGAKGAYQIGVWKALNKIGYKPDIVTGTSVGALNGALITMGDFKKAYAIWSNIDMESVFSFKDTDISKVDSMASLIKKLILQGENASYEPLKKLIDNVINEDEVRNSRIDFGFVTTQFLPLKKVEMFKEDVPKGKLKDYIMASAACYPYMKPYGIDGKKYIDGGYFDNMPVEMALKKGATDIIIVGLNSIGKINKYVDIQAKITYIKPNHYLGDMLIFDKNNSKRNIKLGFLDTMKTFNKLEGNLYTFRKRTYIKVNKYENSLEDIYKKIFPNLPVVSSMQQLARKSIEDYLNKYNNEMFSSNSNILLSFEFAGIIYHMDITKIYGFSSFSRNLFKKVEKQKKNNDYKNILNLSKSIMDVFLPGGINNITQTYDKKNLVCFIMDILNKDILPNVDKKKVWAFSVLVPDVVLSAMILNAYKKEKKLRIYY